MNFIVNCSGQSWVFNCREFINRFPDSLISNILEMCSNTSVIDLQMTCVTSDVMRTLDIILRDDRIPLDMKIPEQAGSYLNIDILQIMAEPNWSKLCQHYPHINLLHPETIDSIGDIFEFACDNNMPSLVHLIISDIRININQYDSWYLYRACSYGYTAIVRLLIRDGRLDLSRYGSGCVVEACAGGHLGIVKLLYPHRVLYHPDMFIRACINGHIDIVNYIRECQEVDIHRALDIFCRYNHMGIIKNLLRDEINVDIKSMIRTAKLHGHKELVKYLRTHVPRQWCLF